MFTEAKRQLQETASRARKVAADLLNPKNYIYRPTSRFLAYTALALSVLAISGDPTPKVSAVGLDNLSHGVAAGYCPPLPTDGRPATCLTADSRLQGIAEQMGLYYVEKNGNGKYDVEDEEYMPVQERRFVVMTLAGGVSSDYVQPDFDTLRHNASGETEVFDAKNRQWRKITKLEIRTVKENGDGRAVDEVNNPHLRVEKNAGDDVDKIWTVTSPNAENNGNPGCAHGGPCTWQCVEWKLVARLDSKANASDVLKGGEFLKAGIHRFKDERGRERISAIAHPVYLFDPSKEPVEVSTSFLNTPFEPGSEFAQRNQIVKKVVYVPFTRVPFTSFTLDGSN